MDLRSEEVLERARKALAKYNLCDHCLGRLFAMIGHGMSNDERGRIVREALGVEETPPEECELCGGIFSERSLCRYAEMALDKAKGIEFETFLVGSRFDEEILKLEEKIWGEVGAEYAESIKMEFNREVGKRIAKISGKIGKVKYPDVVFIIDTRFDVVEIQISSLYIYGRYWKLERGIPQSRWLCPKCRGVGCEYCNYTGKMYPTSVQELIGDPAKEMFEAEDHRIHAMGREDIDARMLGTGRPFILELIKPKKRKGDLKELERIINERAKGKIKVEIHRFANYSDVLKIKGANPRKRYLAKISLSEEVPKEKVIKALKEIEGKVIEQWTPLRVLHRRGNLLRRRKVYEAKLVNYEGKEIDVEFLTDGGTYIKELVSGDMGRTRPSLSELLGVEAKVKELDVLEILWGGLDGEEKPRTKEKDET